MNDKLIFWAVVIWMVGMLVLGVIAVKEIWKDAISTGNEIEEESGEKDKSSQNNSDQPRTVKKNNNC